MRSRWTDRLPFRTLRARLTIWNTFVVFLMTVATLAAARFAARATLYDRADDELRSAVREVALGIEALSPDTRAVVAILKRKAESHEQRGWFMHLLAEDGQSIWKSEHCPDVVANFPPQRVDRDENIVQLGPFRYVRMRVARADGPAYHVRLGTYTTGLDESLTNLMRVLTPLGVAICLLTPLAGYALAVRATRPVADILRTADRLRPTRLGDRLPVRGTADELDRLSSTINGLLDEVARHVDRQQQFVADAAHELRSPLAALQMSLEVAISRDRTAAEYHDMIAEVLDDSQQLATLTNDLLMLAESSDDTPLQVGTVDLVEVARQAMDMFAGVAEEKGVALTLGADGRAATSGDPQQVRQVIGNLLDNAIRVASAGGHVTVEVSGGREQGVVILRVADDGPGIASHHLPMIFDRFYKVDPARSRHAGRRSGGLGLAICRAIVERHGGTIAMASTPGEGTVVTCRFPTSSSSTHSAHPAQTRTPSLAVPSESA